MAVSVVPNRSTQASDHTPAPGEHSDATIPKRRFLLGLLLLSLAFLGQAIYFILSNSQTFDEAVHLTAGHACLDGDFSLNPEHPPLIKELCALPVYLFFNLSIPADTPDRTDEFVFARKVIYSSSMPADWILAVGRLPNALLGTLLVALIGIWSYRLWGAKPGLLAAALAAFDPNLIANASVITMDLGATLFYLVTCYLLWKYSLRPSASLVVAVGISTGLALATKFSMALVPCLVILLLALDKARPGVPLSAAVQSVGMLAVAIFAVAGVVVALCYLGQNPLTWFTGLMWQFDHAAEGHPAFFRGEYSNYGWASYFPAALLVKLPIGTLLLLVGALAFRCGKRLPWQRGIFLLVSPLFFLGVMMQTSINIGVRYVLPVYPFVIILASSAGVYCTRRTWIATATCVACLLATVTSSALIAPHYLAYFNAIAGGPVGGCSWLLDSNLDWGQDLKAVKPFMDRMGVKSLYLSYFGTAPPDYYGIHYQFLPTFSPQATCFSSELLTDERQELVVISLNNLYGVYAADHGFYSWLRSRSIIKQIGYSLYVYDITTDAMAHLELARGYEQIGLLQHAAHEARKALAIDPSNSEASRILTPRHGNRIMP